MSYEMDTKTNTIKHDVQPDGLFIHQHKKISDIANGGWNEVEVYGAILTLNHV